MTNSSPVFRVGTRSSKLALVQTGQVIRRLRESLPDIGFETLCFSTPGDRDRITDLRESPPDFFTRDLDEALVDGRIDLAVHSAKDLPDPMPAGLDWCWLPWREDGRDVLVAARGRGAGAWPASPRIGMSSARREAWCRAQFPAAELLPLRGDIEMRLAQLDEGRYDGIIMAAAALIRLGLQDRITRWIPENELSVPDGQGVLALTFRSSDERARRLRSLFVKPVVFAGAGAGRAGTCTLETAEALKAADVCLHDALLDRALLRDLPPKARVLDAGKRCGGQGADQQAINDLIARYARRGERVVRLKGGDPGIFGRLAEEIAALESLSMPYLVLPGVSSLLTATTGTGMLLTRRGESRGFCVMTSRIAGGGSAPIGTAARADATQVYFMATATIRDTLRELRREGLPPDTPAAIVFDAGAISEQVVRGTVGDIAERVAATETGDKPGILIVGNTAARGYARTLGALAGRRILLTCSETLQSEAIAATRDFGGFPVPFPMIRLVPLAEGLAPLRASKFDWIVLTSPSAVDATVALMKESGMDLRLLPPILACGAGTARAIRRCGLIEAAQPSAEFGSAALADMARAVIRPGQRVLRLRSDAAGDSLARAISDAGAVVEDSVIVRNEPVARDRVPPFDAVFFASRSAVQSFFARHGRAVIGRQLVAAIGRPTAEALNERGIDRVIAGREATARSALAALAAECVMQALREEESGQ